MCVDRVTRGFFSDFKDTREGCAVGYNGKERDNANFADAYDFGARILDTRLGRWLSMDPLAAEYR